MTTIAVLSDADRFPPLAVDHPAAGTDCPICATPLQVGDSISLIRDPQQDPGNGVRRADGGNGLTVSALVAHQRCTYPELYTPTGQRLTISSLPPGANLGQPRPVEGGGYESRITPPSNHDHQAQDITLRRRRRIADAEVHPTPAGDAQNVADTTPTIDFRDVAIAAAARTEAEIRAAVEILRNAGIRTGAQYERALDHLLPDRAEAASTIGSPG